VFGLLKSAGLDAVLRSPHTALMLKQVYHVLLDPIITFSSLTFNTITNSAFHFLIYVNHSRASKMTVMTHKLLTVLKPCLYFSKHSLIHLNLTLFFLFSYKPISFQSQLTFHLNLNSHSII